MVPLNNARGAHLHTRDATVTFARLLLLLLHLCQEAINFLPAIVLFNIQQKKES